MEIGVVHQFKKTAGRLAILAPIVMSIFSLTAQAEPKYAVAGMGATSCGQYLKPPGSTKDASDIVVMTWVQGYLSGSNTQRFITDKTVMKKQPGGETIIAFVDKFCRDNPLKTVYEASIALDFSY